MISGHEVLYSPNSSAQHVGNVTGSMLMWTHVAVALMLSPNSACESGRADPQCAIASCERWRAAQRER